MHIHYMLICCVYSQEDYEDAMKKSKTYKRWSDVFPLSPGAGVDV